MDRIEKFTEECLDYIRDFVSDTLTDSYGYLEAMENKKISPIEKLFFIAYETLRFTGEIQEYEHLEYNSEIKCSNGKTYYPDFNFKVYHNSGDKKNYDNLKLLIELDGHIWHEKTPEQVEKEKQRERDLIKDGYTILRYSGREIWRDPMKIVRECIEEYWKRILNK